MSGYSGGIYSSLGTLPVSLNPDYVPAWNNIGYSLSKLGRNEEVIEVKKKLEYLKTKKIPEMPEINEELMQINVKFERIENQNQEYLKPTVQEIHSYQEIKIRHPLSTLLKFVISFAAFIFFSYIFYLFYDTPDGYWIPGLFWFASFLATLLFGLMLVVDRMVFKKEDWLKNIENIKFSDEGIHFINYIGEVETQILWSDIKTISWPYWTSTTIFGFLGGVPIAVPIPEKYRGKELMGVEFNLRDGSRFFIPNSRLSHEGWVRLQSIFSHLT